MEVFKFHSFACNLALLLYFFCSFLCTVYGQSSISIDTLSEKAISQNFNNDADLAGVNEIKDSTVLNKATFILDVASQVVFPKDTLSSAYVIGIYGKDKDIRSLYNTVKLLSDSLSIHNKPIEVLNFKHVRQLVPVNLLYINGNSKIRIKDISKKLVDDSYVIITENFPFGTSLLNFTITDSMQVQFEIQDEVLKNRGAVIELELLQAENRVLIEKNWGKRKKLERSNELLEVEKKRSDIQEDIIEEQLFNIIEKDEQIEGQRRTIIIGVSILGVFILMSFFIYWLSRLRKIALSQLKQKNKEITDGINYARHIQRAILPPFERIKYSFSDAFVIYIPKDIISGDFYWHKERNEVSMLCVADCTGHGVPGAFLSVMGNDLLSYIVDSSNINNPADVLDKIDEHIKKTLNQFESNRNDGMDMAIISYDAKKSIIRYAGANNALVIVKNNELIEFKPTRRGLGGYSNENKSKFGNKDIQVNKGDCLFLFSDGMPDQFGGARNKKLMRKRLYTIFQDVSSLPSTEQKEKILRSYHKWKGNQEQIDDVLVVGVRI